MKTPSCLLLFLLVSPLAAADWETWVRLDGKTFEARVRQVAPGTAVFELRSGGEQRLAPAQLAERSRRRLAEVLGLLPAAPTPQAISQTADGEAIDASDTDSLEARLGQNAVVTGTVRRLATLGTSGHRLLEFEGGAFGVFIRRSDLEQHPNWPLDTLVGKRVRVQGEIASYREKLQIQVREPAQLIAQE
jgi:hypothetical protein